MKKKRITRGLSLLLAVCVSLTMLPVSAYASVETEVAESVEQQGKTLGNESVDSEKYEEEIQGSLTDDVLPENSSGISVEGENLLEDYGIALSESGIETIMDREEEQVGSGTYTTAQVKASLNSLLSQYPANAKWTRSFAGGSQCYAFAHFIFNSVFNRGSAQVGNGATSSNSTCYKLNNIAGDIRTIGTLPPGYSASSLEGLLESAAPGDYIQVKRRSSGGPHSMIVLSVNASSNTIEIYDANAVASNTIGHYTQTFSYFMERNQGVSVYRYSGYNITPTGHNPYGFVDFVKVGPNYVYVRGWAFDEDAKTQPLDIHIYSRNAAGEAKWVGALKADKERGDVGNAYPGVGNYHGFEGRLSVPSGSQTIEVYGINIGGGVNYFLQGGSTAVNIPADTTKPVVSDVSVVLSYISIEGYKIKCKVSDDGMIQRVEFPSWCSTSATGENAVWFQGDMKEDGTVSCFIPVSKLGNQKGVYQTHIYAYDAAGNCNENHFGGGSVEIDTTPITSMKPIDIGDDFYASVINKGVNKALTANGYNTPVVSKTYTGSKLQKWHFTKNSDGTYQIKNEDSGYSLDNHGAEGTKGSKIILYEDNHSKAQKWQIYQAPENTYFIKPICSTDCVMDLTGMDASEGTLIKLYTYNYSYAQRFEINKMAIPVESVTLDRTELTFTEAGKTHTLTAAITPSDATNQKLTWSSSNPSIAKVDADGKVTAVSNGTAIITAKTEDGNKTATCKVTVSLPVAVTGISLNTTQLSFTEAGEASRLTAAITPQNATNQKVTWSSSNPKVASVDSSGLVTAAANGTTTVTAKTQDGGKTAVCTVTVNIPMKVTGVQMNQTRLSFTAPGETQKLTAKVLPANADNQKVTFQSADTSVAMVMADGTVRAIGNGQTVITASSADGGYTASCTVTVNIPEAEVTVTMSQTELTLDEIGQSVQLFASVTPDSGAAIHWESSHPEVATVDASGLVTALSAGEAVITAAVEGKNSMAMCHVTVNITVPVETITLSETNLKFQATGEARKLTVSVTPENATDKNIIWESSNTAVAEVSASGLVTARSNGSAAIVAKTADGSQSAICFVTVKIPVRVTGITLDQTELSFRQIGETRQLYTDIQPSNADNQKINWTSSDESVVTVDSKGVVTAISDGYAVIMAVTADGNKMAFCSVTVSVPVAVQGISLNKTQLSLKEPKATAQLLAVVMPSDADNKEVEFTSSNPGAASVDANGLVTAVKNGAAVITAETKDGGFTAVCTVVVDIPVLVEEITLNHEKATLTEKGETLKLSASITPSNADNQEVSFSSSDTEVVTVDANGLVTAVGSGFATIMVISADGISSAACQITVELPGEVLPPDPTVTPDPTITPDPTVTPDPTTPPKPTVTPTPAPEKNDVGARFTSKGIVYKVVSDTKTEKTVCVVGTSSNGKTITIPAKVRYNSKSFQVAAIAKTACKGKTKVKKVVIGKNVTTIGAKAFYGCRNVKTVTVKGKKLQTVGKGAFKKLSRNTVIRVPKKMKNKYRRILKGRLSSGVTIK